MTWQPRTFQGRSYHRKQTMELAFPRDSRAADEDQPVTYTRGMKFRSALVLLGLILSMGVANGRPKATRDVEIRLEQNRDHHSTYVLRLRDLTFRIYCFENLDSRVPNLVDSIQAPTPFKLRDRGDLVPPLARSLQTSTGKEHGLLQFFGTTYLQCIDDLKAADLYVNLRLRGSLGWAFNGDADAPIPFPVDMSPGPIWKGYNPSPAVLQKIEELLQGNQEGRYDAVAALASTDAPAGVNRLKKFFDESKGEWALTLRMILRRGFPLAEEPLKFLQTDVLPQLGSVAEVNQYSSWVWGALCVDHVGDNTHGFAWQKIQSLGEQYLDQVITRQGFPGLDRFACYQWDDLLEVAKCYGTPRQIKPLKKHLKEYEKWLYSRDGEESFATGYRHQPGYREVVENYKRLKDETLTAMKTRAN